MRLHHLFILLSCLSMSCKSADTENFKTPAPERTNKLLFSTDDFTATKGDATNFTTHFTLHQDEFLSIQFTLEKPLATSLQSLAPSLTVDQLLERGNFQFSFLVDGEIAYVENVNKGAGLPDTKTKQLKHTVLLAAPQQLDFWGWFMWLKFMKLGGGRDALTLGTHVLTIEVRSYLKQDELRIGPLLAEGNITVEVPAIEVDETLVPLQETQPGSGWELSTERFDTAKIEALNRKIAEQRFEHINGIVVIKEGRLLIEEYFNGEARDSLHDPKSVGKSIASTVMGIAIEEKLFDDEHDLLKDYYDLTSFENYTAKKDSVTLKSLLTMTSAFLGDDNDYNSPGYEENMYPTDNWVQFALNLPMDQSKTIGKDFSYFTAGVVILGDVLHQTVPEGLVAYADKQLFAPLGITNYRWEYTPQKVGNTAGGIRLRAIDFAKYGQLYKNNGLWNGEQILSPQWVEKSLGKQVKQSLDPGHYGYLFWNKTYTHDGQEYEVAFCNGNGGNKVFIFKDIPFVIVITASAYNSPDSHANVDKMMVEYILPALLSN
jgi:CubicO group peptidase (beta-lactamase class C family)